MGDCHVVETEAVVGLRAQLALSDTRLFDDDRRPHRSL